MHVSALYRMDHACLCSLLHLPCSLQGFYVVIDHQSYQERDPNMQNPALFAANWGNLWRMITELRGYQEHMKGRVFPGELAFQGAGLFNCALPSHKGAGSTVMYWNRRSL